VIGPLRVTRDGFVAHVTLSRPDVRNAFNAELIAELRARFEELAELPPDELRGVVLAGDGASFSAGADVTWMRAAQELSVEENEADAGRMAAMFGAIDE
jgi:methylglutaconyl-CoA hydratase